MELLPQLLVLFTLLEEGDSKLYFLLLGPISAIGFYGIIYMYYRNTDKRFEYEELTQSEVENISGSDNKIGKVRGVTNEVIEGVNCTSHTTRLGPHTSVYHKLTG